MKTSRKAAAIQMPLLGEVLTLHQAIAWIAFADPNRQLDLAVPAHLMNSNTPICRQENEAARILNAATRVDTETGAQVTAWVDLPQESIRKCNSEGAIWINDRLKQHEKLALAATTFAKAIDNRDFALRGSRLKGSLNHWEGEEVENPIPLSARALDCRIPFDYLLNDGGRLLFITGESTGHQEWLAYRNVHAPRSEVQKIKPLSDVSDHPTQEDYTGHAIEFVESQHAIGRKPTRDEIKAAIGAPESMFRVALRATDAAKRQTGGAPPKKPQDHGSKQALE
jgi:hypothetical protein